MKFVIVLVCFVALAAAVEDKPDADLNTNIEVPADQDADDWHHRRYYGHYYSPYGYYPYGYRYNKHWRGRRSLEEIKPEADKLTIANVEAADQEANEWHGRRYHGYYGYYNPYGYYPYGYRYNKHWRGRRSVEEIKPEEDQLAADVESADQEANEWHGRRYHGYHGYHGYYNPYGYRNYYGRYGYWW